MMHYLTLEAAVHSARYTMTDHFGGRYTGTLPGALGESVTGNDDWSETGAPPQGRYWKARSKSATDLLALNTILFVCLAASFAGIPLLLLHLYPMQRALELPHAQTASQDAPFGISTATLVWISLLIPLLGSLLQDARKYALYRLGRRLRAREQRLYRSFRPLRWFEIAIVTGLTASALALWLHDDQDPAQAASFAAALQRPALSQEEVAELERAVLSDKVPLLLQRRFAAKLLNNEVSFRSSGGSEADARLRTSRVLNAVSMHLNYAFQANRSNTQLADAWPMVQFYAKTHRRIEGNEHSCNETIVLHGGEIYAVTAQHCAKDIWLGQKYAFDQANDIAVKYIPPSLYGTVPGGVAYQKPPQSLPTLFAGNAFGRLVVLDGYGFAYAGNVVRKVYFSFAIPDYKDTYAMFIPLTESTRRFDRWSPTISFLAQGLSGTGIADAETGQIVGVARQVYLMDSVEGTRAPPNSTEFSPCPNSCLTKLVFSSSSHVLKLLPESRALAGLNSVSQTPKSIDQKPPSTITSHPAQRPPLSATNKGKPKVR